MVHYIPSLISCIYLFGAILKTDSKLSIRLWSNKNKTKRKLSIACYKNKYNEHYEPGRRERIFSVSNLTPRNSNNVKTKFRFAARVMRMATGKNSFDVVSHTFPREICFIDAKINSLFDVHLDSGLISLNLHCNNISVIENLDKLKHLKHLDLSSNHIAKMRGLGGLMSLKTLNLACNELQVVEGLENLRYNCSFMLWKQPKYMTVVVKINLLRQEECQ